MLRLDEPLFMAEKTAIVECFWRVRPPAFTMAQYEPYFEFYSQEMKALCLAFDKEDSILERMAAKTHADLRLIVRELAKEGGSNLFSAIVKVKALFPRYRDDDAAIRLSIDLTLRVWLFLDTREAGSTVNTGSVSNALRWEFSHLNLRSFVAWPFPSTVHGPSLSGSFFHGNFTAYKLHCLYGIAIKWTNFLPNHLYYDYASRSLYVFPHKTCLLGMLNNLGEALR